MLIKVRTEVRSVLSAGTGKKLKFPWKRGGGGGGGVIGLSQHLGGIAARNLTHQQNFFFVVFDVSADGDVEML